MSNTPIIAIIPTRDRPDLLRARALRSIWAQSRRPDEVIVIDDGLTEGQPLSDARLLRNVRSPGLSGASNTGIFDAAARWPPDSLIAFLDDDDAWHPEYLERVATAATREVDVVATDIEWLGLDTPALMPAPNTLHVDDFLVGNPGIQGSNLVVRLCHLVLVGGFDESLPSTTDRDLMIRLIDRRVCYRRVDRVLVTHYAEQNRVRLSSPGSATKAAGLRRFLELHGNRMSPSQRARFAERAERYGWLLRHQMPTKYTTTTAL